MINRFFYYVKLFKLEWRIYTKNINLYDIAYFTLGGDVYGKFER